MCQTVDFEGQIIDGGDQLKALVGADNIVFLDGANIIADNECLCHVDIEATARKSGLVCKRAEWTDFALTRKKS